MYCSLRFPRPLLRSCPRGRGRLPCSHLRSRPLRPGNGNLHHRGFFQVLLIGRPLRTDRKPLFLSAFHLRQGSGSVFSLWKIFFPTKGQRFFLAHRTGGSRHTAILQAAFACFFSLGLSTGDLFNNRSFQIHHKKTQQKKDRKGDHHLYQCGKGNIVENEFVKEIRRSSGKNSQQGKYINERRKKNIGVSFRIKIPVSGPVQVFYRDQSIPSRTLFPLALRSRVDGAI